MVHTGTKPALTGDDLQKLSTGMGQRYELVEGALVEMTPSGLIHGMVVGRATVHLGGFVLDTKAGIIVGAETGFYTRRDKKTVRAPDLAFISTSKLPKGGLPEGYSRIAPDLVVEVVSPNDKADEIEGKVRDWLKFGVRMVWVIYPQAQTVHVYTDPSTARILSADEKIDGGSVLPGFEMKVRTFFSD